MESPINPSMKTIPLPVMVVPNRLDTETTKTVEKIHPKLPEITKEAIPPIPTNLLNIHKDNKCKI